MEVQTDSVSDLWKVEVGGKDTSALLTVEARESIAVTAQEVRETRRQAVRLGCGGGGWRWGNEPQRRGKVYAEETSEKQPPSHRKKETTLAAYQ